MTAMASLLSLVGYRRKHAFLLRQSVLRILPLLIQTRTASGSNTASVAGPITVTNEKNVNLLRTDAGVLDCLRKICEVYGIQGWCAIL